MTFQTHKGFTGNDAYNPALLFVVKFLMMLVLKGRLSADKILMFQDFN